MLRTVFIFVDGIGLAPAADTNPFAGASMPVLRSLLGGAITTETGSVMNARAAMVPLDPRLDMPGLPQSGTGQATLMTGENCAKLHGSHFGPYPPSKVRPVLLQRNLFATCAALKKPFDFVNAYPQKYFDYLNAHPALKPSIASSFESTGRALRTADDMLAGNAISADVQQERWGELGYENIPMITLAEGGARLARIAGENAFTMFEYWLTDKAGHKQDMAAALLALERLDGLIGGMLDALGDHTLIVITSDHGNMEDLSVATHTLNPVPLIAIGNGAAQFVERATTLMDVAPGIVSRLMAGE